MNTRGRRDAIEAASQLSRPIRARLARAIDESDLSARGVVRTLRVARTIADLDGSDEVLDEHVSNALAFRVDIPSVSAATA